MLDYTFLVLLASTDPILAPKGDLVVVFLGGSTPFILREEQTEDGDRVRDWREHIQLGNCKLVGEAYVDSLMGGEGVVRLGAQDERIVEIELV